MNKVKILSNCILFFSLIYSYSFADTLYLKNGSSINGIIKKEDDLNIELEIGGGSVKFSKKEIAKVSKTNSEDSALLRKKWKKDKFELEQRLILQKIEEEGKPRKVSFYHDAKGMNVGVTINDKVEARMILDTGDRKSVV